MCCEETHCDNNYEDKTCKEAIRGIAGLEVKFNEFGEMICMKSCEELEVADV